MELSRELDPELVHGNVICLLTANPSAARTFTRFVVPEDGKNPEPGLSGKKGWDTSEKIAYAMVHELQSLADYCIDVHGGDTSEEVMPFVYYTGAAREEVCRASEAMAMATDTAVRARSGAATGAYSCACIHVSPRFSWRGAEEGYLQIRRWNSINRISAISIIRRPVLGGQGDTHDEPRNGSDVRPTLKLEHRGSGIRRWRRGTVLRKVPCWDR